MFRFGGVGSGGLGNERERRERARAPGTVREWDSWELWDLWDQCCTGGRPLLQRGPLPGANNISILPFRRPYPFLRPAFHLPPPNPRPPRFHSGPELPGKNRSFDLL